MKRLDLNTSELAEGPSKCLVRQYSQENEDEIIDSALGALPSRDRWCVEFGAWDGIFASNSRRLIKHYNYSAILIEADVCRFKQLRENYKDYQNVVVLRDFVGWQSNTLDTILSNTPAPKTFDLLSIDIDGNDYHVWKALSVYRPKLVCIEFNPTVATSVRFVQSADSRVNQGCSLASLVDLAKEKNYELIAVSHCNAFFVDAVYYQLFGLKDNHPASLRRDCGPVTHIFFGYDGTVHLAGHKRLPWHSVEVCERRLQVLPRWLRRYPGNYTIVQKMLFGVYLLFYAPRELWKYIARRYSRKRSA